MGKLTKTAVVSALEEVEKLVGGFNVPINTSGLQAEVEVNVHQTFLDIELDEDDRSNLSKETIKTIDALKAKYPEMTPTPDDDDVVEEKVEKKSKKDKKEKNVKKEKEAPIEEVKEEKKGKKAKKEATPEVKETKKGKKEKAPVEEAPAPAKKEKKGKKGGNDALIEKINTVPYKELKDIVKGNDVFTGFPAVGLSNDAFRSELIAVLNGEKSIDEVKEAVKSARTAGKEKASKEKQVKESKSKKAAEPTLTEQVNAAEDLDALKAICKANADSFPGVKAKKFDKVKKLRKAMLEVIVEQKPAKKEKKATTPKAAKGKNGLGVIATIMKVLTDADSKKGVSKKEIHKILVKNFPERSPDSMKNTINVQVPGKLSREKFEVLTLSNGNYCKGSDEIKSQVTKTKKVKEEISVEKTKKSKKEKKNKKNKKNK